MRISRVRVQGFRCLEDIDVPFDDVTTLIGPNGVGKSSLLRALDWFFNGPGGLSEDDLGAHAPDGRIRVEVEFTDVTEADREQLGGYAPEGVDKVLLWRTWTDGDDVFSGNARTYDAFSEIRSLTGAQDRRDCYNELRREHPDLGLPTASSAAKVDEALLQWESEHPDQLTDSEVKSTTKFFGFLGGAKLSGILDYVFISADLRASDEAEDSRGAAIGRLLERTIDRSAVTSAVDTLIDKLNVQQIELVAQHLASPLEALAADLTAGVAQFTAGREIQLQAEPAAVKVTPLRFTTKVVDGTVLTPVSGQGHGFQRALLVAALRMVAERGRHDPSSGAIVLAIEEPELYQHPAQARAFAATLRTIAEDHDQAVQVVYATHSPLFIEPGRFHQLRRMRRVIHDGRFTPMVVTGDRDQVSNELAGVMNGDQARRQIDKACPQQLSEAVFADAVMLVEGETDKAIFEAVAHRTGGIAASNISVLDVSGKDSLPLCRAILGALGIPSILVADNDADHKIEPSAEASEKAKDGQARAIRSNRRLLKSIGATEQDWPATGLHGDVLFFFEPNLEDWLRANWPAWESARARLVDQGFGYGGKHARTYFNAVSESISDPPSELVSALDRVATLIGL